MPPELEQYEAILSKALLAADPWTELRTAIEDPATPASVSAALANVGEDGLRIAGLLVAKLRFERIVNGSRRAAEWFEDDAARFTEAFRRYHAAVSPTEIFPSSEARCFEAWLSAP